MKRETEKKTGQTCEIIESEGGHALKCSSTIGGSNSLSSRFLAGITIYYPIGIC